MGELVEILRDKSRNYKLQIVSLLVDKRGIALREDLRKLMILELDEELKILKTYGLIETVSDYVRLLVNPKELYDLDLPIPGVSKFLNPVAKVIVYLLKTSVVKGYDEILDLLRAYGIKYTKPSLSRAIKKLVNLGIIKKIKITSHRYAYICDHNIWIEPSDFDRLIDEAKKWSN